MVVIGKDLSANSRTSACIKPSATLREGLEEFYHHYREHLHHVPTTISLEAESFFKSHDIAHVVFGCDISLYGEGSVKIWTIFGTTLGFWNHLRGYRDANAILLTTEFGLVHSMANICRLLFAIPALIYRAKSMSKPWHWNNYEQYLDTPLSDIRREFHIKVPNS